MLTLDPNKVFFNRFPLDTHKNFRLILEYLKKHKIQSKVTLVLRVIIGLTKYKPTTLDEVQPKIQENSIRVIRNYGVRVKYIKEGGLDLCQ